jgi:hypothetical protein
MPAQPKSQFERFLRPILASRFLTISAVFHLLIILLFGGTVLFSHYVEPPDFQATGDTTVATDSAPPAPPPDATLPPTSADPSSNAPPPLPAPSLMAMATLNPTATSFSVPMPAIPPPTIGKELTAQPTSQLSTANAVALPGAMAGRGTGRDGTGQRFGEKPPAEEAVMKALRWLQSQQQSTGMWGSAKYTNAFTGLALLCYLGHGDTPQGGGEFSVVVTNAINALVTEGNQKQGKFISAKDFNSDNDTAYEHAICTYALCEAYTMTKDPRLGPLVQQAVDYIVKAQRSDGGWTYKYDTSPDTPGEKQYKSDTSVSGWQIQALKAAHLTGIDGMDKEVRPILDNAMKNLDRVFNEKDGTYGYRKAGDSFSSHGRTHYLTGVGALSKLFWLGRLDKDTRAAFKDIESNELNYNDPNCDLYAWYYDTQACFQAQGSAWQWWNSRFQDLLTSVQSTDGSWPKPAVAKIGDYDANADGPLYRTTLCCLMLEVFYRYLPTSEVGGMQNGPVEGL